MTKKKDPKDHLKMGAPTKYTEKLAIEILSSLGMGNSLAKTCRQENMPSFQSVYTWLKKYPDFLEDYTRAKDDSADANADKIDEIAEGVLAGEFEPANARTAIDAYKWSAAHKKPKKYGDKQQIEHSGQIGLADLSDVELQNKLDELRDAKDE